MIEITTAANNYFKEVLNSNPNSCGIKITVKESGCSGKAYIVDLITNEIAMSQIASGELQEQAVDDLKFYIKPEEKIYMDKLKLDCVQEGLNTVVKFNNTDAKGSCGCGESFAF